MINKYLIDLDYEEETKTDLGIKKTKEKERNEDFALRSSKLHRLTKLKLK